MNQLDSVEKLIVELVDAGANQIDAVEFLSYQLRELRAQARRLAVVAAKKKAVKVGRTSLLPEDRALALSTPRSWAPREDRDSSWEDFGSVLLSPERWLPQLKPRVRKR